MRGGSPGSRCPGGVRGCQGCWVPPRRVLGAPPGGSSLWEFFWRLFEGTEPRFHFSRAGHSLLACCRLLCWCWGGCGVLPGLLLGLRCYRITGAQARSAPLPPRVLCSRPRGFPAVPSFTWCSWPLTNPPWAPPFLGSILSSRFDRSGDFSDAFCNRSPARGLPSNCGTSSPIAPVPNSAGNSPSET